MADWKIVDGNLPFKDGFAVRPTEFDDYPNWIWHNVADELPYKVVFPTLFAIDDAPKALWKISDDLPFKSSFAPRFIIDDAPASLWKIIDGDLPFKSLFPKNYGITDVPLGIWAIKDGDLPYRRNFPPMPGPPTMWGTITELTLSQMHNSPILLKTQKSQDVQIGDTTIPHQITKRLFEGIDWELI